MIGRKRKSTANDGSSSTKKRKTDGAGEGVNKEAVKGVSKKGKKIIWKRIVPRTSPLSLVEVLQKLSTEQKNVIREIGFGTIIDYFKITHAPTAMGNWVIENYDPKSSTLKLNDGRKLKITTQTVHDALGIPMGRIKITPRKKADKTDETTSSWRETFKEEEDDQGRLYVKPIMDRINNSIDLGDYFKTTFLVLFMTLIAESTKNGCIN